MRLGFLQQPSAEKVSIRVQGPASWGHQVKRLVNRNRELERCNQPAVGKGGLNERTPTQSNAYASCSNLVRNK